MTTRAGNAALLTLLGALTVAVRGSTQTASPATETPPSPKLKQLGCGAVKGTKDWVVCVDACDGTLQEPPPTLTAGQRIILRIVGENSCRPTAVECSSKSVGGRNVAFRVPLANPSLVSSVASGTQATTISSPKGLNNGGPTTLDSSAGAIDKVAPAVNAAASARVVETSKAVKRAAADAAKPGLHTADLSAALAIGKSFQTRSLLSPSADAKKEELTSVIAIDRSLANADQALREAGGRDLPGVVADRKADAHEALATVQRNTPQAQAATRAIQAYVDALDALDALNADDKDVDETERLRVAANQAIAGAQQEAKQRDAQTPQIFGDCVIDVPADPADRQIILQATIHHAPVCGGSGQPECPQSQPAPTGVVVADPTAVTAVVTLDLDQGVYFLDVGALIAVLPRGKETVTNPPRPGNPAGGTIHRGVDTAYVVGASVNVYPFGHRRGSLGFWDGRTTPLQRISDTFGLQFGFSANPKDPSASLFAGALIEPAVGLGLSAGVMSARNDQLNPGYAEGMLAPANRGDYVSSATRAYGYFGLTLSYELFNTLLDRSRATSGAP